MNKIRMKATAIAPSNIAFIKYWGKKNELLRIPENGSISMNLSNLLTTTTVEFDPNLKKDIILLCHSGQDGYQTVTRQARMTDFEKERVTKHLNRIRKMSGVRHKARVESLNNFPGSTGLSSSASGFAALTLAGSNAAGLNLSEKALSILARQGSGSACRSIPDGFTEWLDGGVNSTSYAVSIFPHNHWNIADVIAIVSSDKKEISTSSGQQSVFSSRFFPVRLSGIKEKIRKIKQYIKEKNFQKFGEILEAEALELHAIMMTSDPGLVYFYPETIRVIHAVRKWRGDGLPVYFTLNTGHNIHIICQKKDIKKVVKKLEEISDVKKTIVNYPSQGARIVKMHLF
jgi:diphosphomevalonate decarboxylase